VVKRQTVVDRVLAHDNVGGSPAELARQLSKLSGRHITRQMVHGWKMRGIFPRDMIVHVEQLCGIGLEELLLAKPRDRDAGNTVNRAIRFLGPDAQASTLAAELSKLSGSRVTRQMVNGWQVLEQFPVGMVPYVHVLTGIPVRDLLEGRKAKSRPPGRGRPRRVEKHT
jgi:hypothetical protein